MAHARLPTWDLAVFLEVLSMAPFEVCVGEDTLKVPFFVTSIT